MSQTPAVDATAEELPMPEGDRETGAELARRHATGALTVAPEANVDDLVARMGVIQGAMDRAMTKDVDYGVIPGTNKPSLLKPGAEKLASLFQLDIEPTLTTTWGPGDHLTVECTTTVYHAPTGARLGAGVGICTTRERKYGKRRQERTCPTCGAAAVIKGKEEYGGGWLCWKKRDGCGTKFPEGDPAIAGQDVGEIDNPDLPDTWNTVAKMAKKRAMIDAILAVTGASAIFTQDVEEQAGGAGGETDGGSSPAPRPQGSDVPQSVTPQQYGRIVDLFQSQGADAAAFEALLDQVNAPPGPEVAFRVRDLTSPQAEQLIDLLTGGES